MVVQPQAARHVPPPGPIRALQPVPALRPLPVQGAECALAVVPLAMVITNEICNNRIRFKSILW